MFNETSVVLTRASLLFFFANLQQTNDDSSFPKRIKLHQQAGLFVYHLTCFNYVRNVKRAKTANPRLTAILLVVENRTNK